MDHECRYNVDGIWGWNVHDGDWIYRFTLNLALTGWPQVLTTSTDGECS